MQKSKPHFEVAAGLICKGGKVLIAKRLAGTHLAGYWEFPGGKREEGETLQQCLQREILEELGLHVEIKRFLCKVDHEYESKSISLHLFQCSEPEGEPAPLECESIAWVLPEELGSQPMPPADEKLILLIKNLKKKNEGF